METEPTYFQKDVQNIDRFKKIFQKVFWTPNLFASIISHQVPMYLAWKLDQFSKRTDAFQLSLVEPQVMHFSPIFVSCNRF